MSDEDAIRELLARYQRALDEGDAGLAEGCFAPDAIVAGAGFPTIEGSELPAAYQQMFKAVRMAVVFEVEEVVLTSADTAWARTTSQGTQTAVASGDLMPESNRELFILARRNTEWKILRYLFNESPR